MDAYRKSKQLAAEGKTQYETRLLRRNDLYGLHCRIQGRFLRRMHVSLQYLMGELLHKTAKNESDLFEAESYAVAAICNSQRELTY